MTNRRWLLARWVAAALFGTGCASQDHAPVASVSDAWRQHDPTAPASTTAYRPRAAEVGDAGAVPLASGEAPIALVAGRPIARSRVVDILLRSHGAGVLEQLIGLEVAMALATQRGLTVNEKDVDFEYALGLRRLSDPLSPATSGGADRAVAESLLDTVLAERNISREEFFITLRRNAYLRKLIEADLVFSEEQLRAEFARAYGDRVQVRHIQLAGAADAGRIKERLAAGEDFSDLASRYSANADSARNRGLLEPFASQDEEVPALFRQTALCLAPGQVSPVIRVGEWHHILKLEQRLPAETRDFTEVRGELERRLREREAELKMRELYETLLRDAEVDVRDPVLREAFERRRSPRSP